MDAQSCMIDCRDLVKVYDSTQTATVALAGSEPVHFHG